MKRKFTTGLLALVFVISACATGLEEVKKEKQTLRTALADKTAQNERLNRELANCKKLSSTLSREKKAKDKNIFSLRTKTRNFLQSEFDSLNAFSKNEELMDYFGGEPIKRAVFGGKNLTVVNMKPIPSDAVIYMFKGYFDAANKLIPLLFRKTQKGIFCVWRGKEVIVDKLGLQKVELDTPLNALKGDYIGFYFPSAVGAPFDKRTGNFSVFNKELLIGDKLPKKGQYINRNYSLGISGLFN